MAKRYTGPYVSRGGEKLRGALEAFNYSVAGKRVLDVGASTGGFTDCLLQCGATKVTALDVAYGQFAWKLRQDERVTVVERTNFKTADLLALGAPFDLVVADLSFIALSSLTNQFKIAVGEIGDLILLVKPQFEARREEVGEGGVIRDPQVHEAVLRRTGEAFAAAGLMPQVWTHSPLTGPKGNIEFWLMVRGGAVLLSDVAQPLHSGGECASIESVVQAAHEMMGAS